MLDAHPELRAALRRRAWLALAACLVAACGGAPDGSRAPSKETTMTTTSAESTAAPALSCALLVRVAQEGELSVAFKLRSTAPSDTTVTLFRPLLDFTLRASRDGAPLTVVQPALDVPVQPSRVTVPAGGSVEVGTPIRLAFDVDPPAGGGSDGFRWTLVAAPGPVDFEATLTVGGATLEPCRARFEGP